MKSRVLFLDHTGVLGGAELFLLELARHWVGGRRVLLFADGPLRERLERVQVPVEVLTADDSVNSVARVGRGGAQLRAIPGVWRLARRVAGRAADFDVLFANSQKALVVGALAAWMAGKKLVWYLHDILKADHFSGFNRRVSVFLGNRFADRIIANSQASLHAFVASGGRRERTAVVHNGINAPNASPAMADATRQIRAELGWADPIKIVGLFSRVAPWKGQHVLLEALAQLPEMNAWLVGAPLFGDEMGYQEELVAMAKSRGLTDRVRFLGFRDNIPELLNAVDFVVHTSISPEPFGRVIVEGMLAGKPVIATRAGGACEIIQDGETGCLVPPGDSAALAAALRRLVEHPDEAARLGIAGKRSAIERFSVGRMVRGIEREVSGVLATVR